MNPVLQGCLSAPVRPSSHPRCGPPSPPPAAPRVGASYTPPDEGSAGAARCSAGDRIWPALPRRAVSR
jgi:hypothetical protein